MKRYRVTTCEQRNAKRCINILDLMSNPFQKENDEYEEDQLSLPSRGGPPKPPTAPPTAPPTPQWYDSLTWSPHTCAWSNEYINPSLTDSGASRFTEYRDLTVGPTSHLLENAGVAYTESNDWDGTVIVTTGLTNAELHSALFEGDNLKMKGLKQLYDKLQPFTDKGGGDFTPSIQEMEEWFRQVVIHFRRLIGNNVDLNGGKEYFLRSRFGDEKKYTSAWDSYGGICDPSPGVDPHCGWNFLPNDTDQAPYLSAYSGGCPIIDQPLNAVVMSEGISSAPVLPWSVFPSYVIGRYVLQDGMISHTRPFSGYTVAGNEVIGFGLTLYPTTNGSGNWKVRNQWFVT